MSENLKLKCTVVMLQYDRQVAPRDKHVVAINTETKKLSISFLSDMSHLEEVVYFYLTSDRNIEMGDVFYNKLDKEIYITNNAQAFSMLEKQKNSCKKIEASTDPDLDLPKIPPTFIGKFDRKVFNIKQVNINMELLLGNVDLSNRDFPNNKYTVETRNNNTVILSRIDSTFSYEDMLKAFRYGRYSKDPTYSHFGQTGEEFLLAEFDYYVPQD